jgi:hypothetical protein
MRKSEIKTICKRSKIVSIEKMSQGAIFKEKQKENVLMDVRLLRYLTKKRLVNSIIEDSFPIHKLPRPMNLGQVQASPHSPTAFGM